MILAALLQLVVETVLPGAGAWTGVVTSHVGAWGVGIVEWVGNLPGAAWVVRAPAWWVVAGMYGAVLAWAIRKRLGWSRARAAVVLAAAVTGYVGWYAATQRGGAMHVWVLAVGRGSCVVVEGPGGQRVAMNDGSVSVSGVFGRVTEPFLREGGMGEVEGVMATGVGGGQVSGLAELARRYKARVMYCSEVDWAWRKGTYAVGRFFGEMERTKAAVRPVGAGDEVDVGDGVGCRVLWPPKGKAGALQGAQGGLVVELTYEGKKILLVGGRQTAAVAGLERAMAGRGAEYDGAVITSPEVSAEVVEKIHAKWVIVDEALKTAAGMEEDEAEQEGDAMAEVIAAKSRGCVHVTVGRESLRVETFK